MSGAGGPGRVECGAPYDGAWRQGAGVPHRLRSGGPLASRADNDSVRWRSVDGISRTLAREVGAAGSRPRPGFYTYLLDRDAAEEVAEHKRLFYVAATRAADALYISGNETSSGDGWLAAASEVVGTASRDGVEVRQPLIVGGGGGARRPAPRSWNEGGVAISPWRVRTLPSLPLTRVQGQSRSRRGAAPLRLARGTTAPYLTVEAYLSLYDPLLTTQLGVLA